MKQLAWWLVLVMAAGALLAQEAPKEKRIIPLAIQKDLEALRLQGAVKNDYAIELWKSLAFPTSEAGKAFAVVFFKMQLNADIALYQTQLQNRYEEWKKTYKPKEGVTVPDFRLPAYYHLLFLRLYDKENKLLRETASEIPFSEGENNAVFAFGLPLPAGSYTLLLEVTRRDHSAFSVVSLPLDVPDIFASGKLLLSAPIFVRGFRQLSQVESTFRVYKNSFSVGNGVFYIYNAERFKGSDHPILMVNILGAGRGGDNLYNLDVGFAVEQAGQKVGDWEYKDLTLSQRPAIYQPLLFLKKDKSSLAKGSYTLQVKVGDKLLGGSQTLAIPFEISE